MEGERDYPKYETMHEFFDSDLDCTGRVGIARICDLLQAAATAHADLLGVGMSDFLKQGCTWMLLTMSVCLDAWPKTMGAVKLTTWPAGVRGRLACRRDYTLDAQDGTRLVRTTSDWGCVDARSRRIARLPERVLSLAPGDVPQVDVEPMRRPPQVPASARGVDIPVRRADLDVNCHVNNVHYVDWLFEPLCDEAFARRLRRLDVAYRGEARLGDVVESVAEAADGGRATLHELRRKADGTALVTAACRWE